MTDRLLASFESVDSQRALPTYRFLWEKLGDNGYPVRAFNPHPDLARFPDTDDGKKAFIPAGTLMQLAEKPTEVNKLLGNNGGKRRNRSRSVLSPRDTASRIKSVGQEYSAEEAIINEETGRNKRADMLLAAAVIFTTAIYKTIEPFSNNPELIQGRLADLMGVPAIMSMAIVPERLIRHKIFNLDFNRFGKLDRLPVFSTLGLSGRATGIFLAWTGVEIAQGLGMWTGTFDPGDIVAYGIGAVAAVGAYSTLEKLRERRIRSRLDQLSKRR